MGCKSADDATLTREQRSHACSAENLNRSHEQKLARCIDNGDSGSLLLSAGSPERQHCGYEMIKRAAPMPVVYYTEDNRRVVLI